MKGRLRARSATLTGLAVCLGLLAGCAAVLGIVFVGASAPDEALRDIGRWLLQLALVFAGTGVVSVVVRRVELVRARREAWVESLHQLVAVHDEAQMAVRLLSAHATAKTYAEQISVLTSSRVTLRRLSSAPEVQGDNELHDSLVAMRKYLKQLVKEYQEKYLPVARQQRLDEAVITFRLKRLAESDEIFPRVADRVGRTAPGGPRPARRRAVPAPE